MDVYEEKGAGLQMLQNESIGSPVSVLLSVFCDIIRCEAGQKILAGMKISPQNEAPHLFRCATPNI